jgi:hypothetical protein
MHLRFSRTGFNDLNTAKFTEWKNNYFLENKRMKFRACLLHAASVSFFHTLKVFFSSGTFRIREKADARAHFWQHAQKKRIRGKNVFFRKSLRPSSQLWRFNP